MYSVIRILKMFETVSIPRVLDYTFDLFPISLLFVSVLINHRR